MSEQMLCEIVNVGEENRFRVSDDKSAEWCLTKIREARQEAEKWKEHYRLQMEKVQKEAADTVAFFEGLLSEYFDTVPHKETKTQQSYSLPSGKLVRKQQQPQFTTDDAALVPWLKSNAMTELIKVKESADWAALKKLVTVTPDGESVMDENGEVVPGVVVTQRPDVFKVEMEG